MAYRSDVYRIVAGQTMAEVDRTAIEERGVSGLFLMENAGRGVAASLLDSIPPHDLQNSCILCGKGNNGGDGFVIARYLEQEGLSPKLALLGKGEELKGDARTNFILAGEAGVKIKECTSPEDLDAFFLDNKDSRIWIEALLGTGSRGAPRGLIGQAVETLNSLRGQTQIVSVDIPAGVEADTGKVEGNAVLADQVYTMGLPKIGQVLPPGLDYCKELIVLDIGFPHDLLENAECEAELLTPEAVNTCLPKRSRSAHKGSEGHLLIIAGSKGMTGAALMCAQSAIRMGAGLVTCACPDSLLPIYASNVWEMLTVGVKETEKGAFHQEAFDTLFADRSRYDAVVIGPGLSLDPSSAALVRRVVNELDLPILIDGDGLSALTIEDLHKRTSPWVATPHPGEMARLFNATTKEVQSDRWGFARKLQTGQGVAVLKGAHTVIAYGGERLFVNPTGNPAMAQGGMGDVLAGAIGALLAKPLSPEQAACAGVYLHGLAADLLVKETGAESVSALEVCSYLRRAVRWVRHRFHNRIRKRFTIER